MTALEQAMRLEKRDINDSTFEEDLAFHLAHGLVCSDDGIFLLAREVDDSKPELFETYHIYPKETCNAWFVWTAVGNIHIFGRLLAEVIRFHPNVYRRAKGKIRVCSSDRILKTINKKK